MLPHTHQRPEPAQELQVAGRLPQHTRKATSLGTNSHEKKLKIPGWGEEREESRSRRKGEVLRVGAKDTGGGAGAAL